MKFDWQHMDVYTVHNPGPCLQNLRLWGKSKGSVRWTWKKAGGTQIQLPLTANGGPGPLTATWKLVRVKSLGALIFPCRRSAAVPMHLKGTDLSILGESVPSSSYFLLASQELCLSEYQWFGQDEVRNEGVSDARRPTLAAICQSSCGEGRQRHPRRQVCGGEKKCVLVMTETLGQWWAHRQPSWTCSFPLPSA